MVVTSIKNLLGSELEEANFEDYSIYIFRDGETIFYVGKSRVDVVNRALEHLGRGWRPSYDMLYQTVKANLPVSLNWTVEFRKPRYKTTVPPIKEEDWLKLSPALRFFSSKEGFEFYSDNDINRTEKELIGELHPCLNVTYNKKPSELPERYKDPRIPDLEVTVSDFIPLSDSDSLDTSLGYYHEVGRIENPPEDLIDYG